MQIIHTNYDRGSTNNLIMVKIYNGYEFKRFIIYIYVIKNNTYELFL